MRFEANLESYERLKTDEFSILDKKAPVVCHGVSSCLMVLHLPFKSSEYFCYHFPGSELSQGMYWYK